MVARRPAFLNKVLSMISRYQTPQMAELFSEARRYQTWALVEAYVLEAWQSLGQVPAGTAERLLDNLAQDPLDQNFAERVAELEAQTRHDVVAFTRALSERYPDPALARYIHLGLTSTDVVDTAQNVILREGLAILEGALLAVLAPLRALALRYKMTPAVGRTHGIHAEPTSFGLRFLAFMAAFDRDRERLAHARVGISVAMISGSVGNYAHIPPEIEAHVAGRLGLDIEPISTQVVPRDRHAEVLAALAILGSDLDRVATELRHLQRSEVGEVAEPFSAGQTGSSSMPHKKNPITLENISGLSRILRANLQAGLEDIPLWHERDISHSSAERVILPDSLTLAHYALGRLERVLNGLQVYPENIQRNLEQTGGLIYSQRVLNLLIDKGMERDSAYALVQRAALESWQTHTPLRELLARDSENPLSPAELAQAFDPAFYLAHVERIYARMGI